MVLNVPGGLFGKSAGLSGEEARAATVIVAKDGSGDTDDIQEGINMLSASGGVVYVREGIYTITSAITFPNHNITLQGTGRGSVIYTTSNITMINITKNGVSIKDLFVKGNSAGASQTGISLSSASNCFITDCWIEDLNSVAIASTGAINSNIISRNFIKNIGTYGFYFVVNATTMKDVMITNNLIQNITSNAGVQLSAINAAGLVEHCIISGNIIINAGTAGVLFLNAAGSSIDQNIISNNQIHDCGMRGVYISDNGSDRTLIHGNIILNNTGGQIFDNGINTTAADNITA